MQTLKWRISTFKPVLLRSSLGSSNTAKSHAYVQFYLGDLPYCCKTSLKPKPTELAEVGYATLRVNLMISSDKSIWQTTESTGGG